MLMERKIIYELHIVKELKQLNYIKKDTKRKETIAKKLGKWVLKSVQT